jgi:hypothetical protein
MQECPPPINSVGRRVSPEEYQKQQAKRKKGQ